MSSSRTCLSCNGPLNSQAQLSLVVCSKCYHEMMTDIASRSAFKHLLDFFECIFNFEFIISLGALSWSISRLFNIGDYNKKDGMFSEGVYYPERDEGRV